MWVADQPETSLRVCRLVQQYLNDAPVVEFPLSDQVTLEDVEFIFQFPEDTFLDIDPQDTLIYTATAVSWLTFNPDTRTFNGTPTNDDVGFHTVQINATDSNGDVAFDIFVIQVINVNDAPYVSSELVDQTAREGDSFSYTFLEATFEDVDPEDTLLQEEIGE